MSETKWTEHPSGADWSWGWNGDQCNVWGVAIILGNDKKTREANARLISSAPELYAALVNLIGWVPGPVHFHNDEPQKAVERARAALAKARGEQP